MRFVHCQQCDWTDIRVQIVKHVQEGGSLHGLRGRIQQQRFAIAIKLRRGLTITTSFCKCTAGS
eukprot:3933684-Rhodomonas_salina.3